MEPIVMVINALNIELNKQGVATFDLCLI